MRTYDELPALARRATEDILRNFWQGNAEEGHWTHVCEEVLWELGMGTQMLESQLLASGDGTLKGYWLAEWDYLRRLFQPCEKMVQPDSPYNPACDDLAWSAMTLMSIFRQTGDEYALRLSRQAVRQAYDCWRDESVDNGLWYRYGEDKTPAEYGWHKSSYCAGLILSAIEQYEYLKGEPETERLMDETLRLHGWVERYLRAEQAQVVGFEGESIRRGLYYTDYLDNKRTGEKHPAWRTPGKMTIRVGSDSALFANTGMASINMLLYRLTGDGLLRQRALETANSLALPPYNAGGVFLNDRDAWTNCAFLRYFVQYVMTDSGIEPELIKLLLDSGVHIAKQRRMENGLYLTDWHGGDAWATSANGTRPTDLKTSGTTVHMITAAHLAFSLGLADRLAPIHTESDKQ